MTMMRAMCTTAAPLAALLGVAALWVVVPEPVQARERQSTLSERSTVRDRHGFRAGTIDTKPNGDRIHRDARGFVTGRDQRTLGGDTILRNERSQAVGRIEGPLPLEGRR